MATPDIVGAVIAYSRAQAAISAEVSTRVSGSLQKAWAMPLKAIVANGPRGGPAVADPPIRRTRVDMECWGTNELTSKLLAEIVRSTFVPDSGASPAFVAANCAVARIDLEAEPIWVPDPDTGWPRTVVPLILNWTAVP